MSSSPRLASPSVARMLVAGLLLVGARADAATATKPPARPSVRTEGALVLDGVPTLSSTRLERLGQYQNVRSASLWSWSPDGKGMLVGTRFAETTQVHYVAAPGADRQQWTFYEDQVGGATFDPSQGTGGFYFTKDAGGGEFFQIYWYDRARGAATLLTDGTSRNEGPVLYLRGGKFAYASTARNGRDFDIWVKEGDAAPRLVLEREGQWNPVGWSLDGRELFLMQYLSVNESAAFVFDLASKTLTPIDPHPGERVAVGQVGISHDGKALYLTTDHGSEWKRLVRLDRRTGARTVLTPDVRWDVSQFSLSLDGKHLAYATNEGGRAAVYLGTPGNVRGARRLPLPAGVLGGFGFDWQSKRLGVSMASSTSPSDVYAVDVRTRKITRWTTSEVGGLDPASFIAPTLLELVGKDGTAFQAWAFRPRGEPPAGTGRAVLVDIHGGPEWQSMAAFNPLVQFLVGELGLVVIQPNVRGSTGYGKTFMTLDDGRRRMDAVGDIGVVLDWIAAQPDLDPTRVAVYGSSYGGFMVLASLIAYADRLRCGVDLVGISHFVTFLEHTEAYRRDRRRVEYGDERDPKMRSFLEEISPRARAGKIRAPLLVVAGANDPRVPASEASAIVAAVRKAGGAAWFILGKDEGHGFRKKSNRDVLYGAVVQFLETHLVAR